MEGKVCEPVHNEILARPGLSDGSKELGLAAGEADG